MTATTNARLTLVIRRKMWWLICKILSNTAHRVTI
jgi:hypothetical protein